eukprot:3884644-Prymnesium_polylepis.1
MSGLHLDTNYVDVPQERPHRRALAALQQPRALREELEQLVVDVRRARQAVAVQPARAEVLAPLLRQPVHHLAAARAARLLALERARVEGHALVPRVHRARVDRELVALALARVAVVDRVLELADRTTARVETPSPGTRPCAALAATHAWRAGGADHRRMRSAASSNVLGEQRAGVCGGAAPPRGTTPHGDSAGGRRVGRGSIEARTITCWCTVRSGAWQSQAKPSQARPGQAKLAWLDLAWLGLALGSWLLAHQAKPGQAKLAWPSWPGLARLGLALGLA